MCDNPSMQTNGPAHAWPVDPAHRTLYPTVAEERALRAFTDRFGRNDVKHAPKPGAPQRPPYPRARDFASPELA